MNHDCRNIRPLLLLMLDGALDDGRSDLVLDHLERCPSCTRRAEQEQTIRSLVRRAHDDRRAAPRSLRRSLETWIQIQGGAETEDLRPAAQHAVATASGGRRAPARIYALAGLLLLAAVVFVGAPMIQPLLEAEAPPDRPPASLASAHRPVSARVLPTRASRVATLPARRCGLVLRSIESIQLADGPALLYRFAGGGPGRCIIQTADRAIDLRGFGRFARHSPVPSAVDTIDTWAPPSGPVTVATFSSWAP